MKLFSEIQSEVNSSRGKFESLISEGTFIEFAKLFAKFNGKLYRTSKQTICEKIVFVFFFFFCSTMRWKELNK